MLILNAAQIKALVSAYSVIEAMRRAFRGEYVVPDRQIVAVPGGSGDRLCLIMPAFDPAGGGVVKLATIFPGNRSEDLPTIQGTIVVFSKTGTPIALLDGGTVTRLRTAAASGLASMYLSRTDSCSLLVVGTGELAPAMAAAHCAVRPINRVWVWGRREHSAVSTAAVIRSLVGPNVEVAVTRSLEQIVPCADIVSCATSSSEPLIFGRWLKAGCFLDLVGSFSPANREADDEAILRSRVFVDTFDGAMKEAGDLLDPLRRKIITRRHIVGELADLVLDRVKGRTHEGEITLFKSVGTAIEDLALAYLVVEAAGDAAGAARRSP
jgi:alanine dehydrogenase